jgi:hypothetical protein
MNVPPASERSGKVRIPLFLRTPRLPLILADYETLEKIGTSPVSPPPISTSVASVQDWPDRATPRAQTRQEFDESGRRTRSSSLEGIQ